MLYSCLNTKLNTKYIYNIYRLYTVSENNPISYTLTVNKKLSSKIAEVFTFTMASAQPVKRKRKLNEEGRLFQGKWKLQNFCATVNGKINCLICNNCIATPKDYNLKRHYETNHRSYDKYEGLMRVSELKELKANLRQQQSFFSKIQKENIASVTASYELS